MAMYWDDLLAWSQEAEIIHAETYGLKGATK